MSDSYEVEHNGIDGEDEMGSFNHSLVQSRLAGLLQFKCDKEFSILTELSLDISQHHLSKYRLEDKYELKPDVCAYLEPPVIPDIEGDLLTVPKMPDLAIEILSPRQAINYLIRKIKAYLALGVKSCWLVIPSLEEIRVFSQPRCYKTFALNDSEVIDEVMDIRLPIQEIFS